MNKQSPQQRAFYHYHCYTRWCKAVNHSTLQAVRASGQARCWSQGQPLLARELTGVSCNSGVGFRAVELYCWWYTERCWTNTHGHTHTHMVWHQGTKQGRKKKKNGEAENKRMKMTGKRKWHKMAKQSSIRSLMISDKLDHKRTKTAGLLCTAPLLQQKYYNKVEEIKKILTTDTVQFNWLHLMKNRKMEKKC